MPRIKCHCWRTWCKCLIWISVRPISRVSVNCPVSPHFIDTSNRFDLLTDPTGSHRFLCVEVERMIDCTYIEHDQIYAQLKAELLAVRRDWFTKEEEQVLQVQNEAFYRVCPAEDVFHSYFRVANPGEKSLGLTAARIFRELQQKNSASMCSVNPMRCWKRRWCVGIRGMEMYIKW